MRASPRWVMVRPEANSRLVIPPTSFGRNWFVRHPRAGGWHPVRGQHLPLGHGREVLAVPQGEQLGEHVRGVVAVDALRAGTVDELRRAAVVKAGGHGGEVSDGDLAEPVLVV